MVRPLRIAFFGTPEFAVPTLRELLTSSHVVCGVVTQPDRPRGRGRHVTDSPVKALARAHGLPVLQPERLHRPEVADALRSWQSDLGVVAAYGKLLPETLLEIPHVGMINVHASLLPRLRGAAPVHRAIINGDTETGITIMRVIKALDAGSMFAKVRRGISPDETSDTVERDLAELGARLLVDVVDRIAGGTASEEPQDEALATYAPRLTKEEGNIDWTLPAPAIHNRVRGLYPWPHAYTYLEDRRVILLQTRVEETPTAERPGTVVRAVPGGIEAATGNAGRIAIERLQLEGGRPISAREFLAGYPLSGGRMFWEGAHRRDPNSTASRP